MKMHACRHHRRIKLCYTRSFGKLYRRKRALLSEMRSLHDDILDMPIIGGDEEAYGSSLASVYTAIVGALTCRAL